MLRKEYNTLRAKSDLNKHFIHLISSALRTYLDEGMRFYSAFVERLESTYLKFSVHDLADLTLNNNCESIRRSFQVDMTIKSKQMKFALMCIHRCWIAQGDLGRYQEMIFASSASKASPPAPGQSGQQLRDYSVARAFYLKAKSIAPKSSRAYHQLAIIAVYTKRRLDACYYYFRCLEVSVPLTSVKQSLNSLFDEARVRSDAILKYIQAAIISKQKKKLNAKPNDTDKEGEPLLLEITF